MRALNKAFKESGGMLVGTVIFLGSKCCSFPKKSYKCFVVQRELLMRALNKAFKESGGMLVGTVIFLGNNRCISPKKSNKCFVV